MSAAIHGTNALTGWLIALALLSPDAVNAQARGPSSSVPVQPGMDPGQVAAAHQAKLAELDVWLRRLAGQFQYDGIKDPRKESARGLGHCVGIGTGPGVQCVVNLSWPSTNGRPGRATHEPAVTLYGIDTNAEGIRRLEVNSKGIPEDALGFLKGNMATFKPGCVNQPEVPPCRRFIRIEAAPDGKFIYIWDDTEFLISLGRKGWEWIRVRGLLLTLRRVPETAGGPPPISTP
jgi:hypothetical protein